MKRYFLFLLFVAIVKLTYAYTWTGTSGAYEFPNDTITEGHSLSYTFTSKPNTEFCLKCIVVDEYQQSSAKIYVDGKLESYNSYNFYKSFSDNATHTVSVSSSYSNKQVVISRAVVKHPIENQTVVKTITLDEAGDLEYYLPASVKYYIKKLTISGPINGKDMAIIRDMAGLQIGELSVLNMSGVQMKSGGGPCGVYYYEWTGSYGEYEDPAFSYTSDDVISSGLFYRLDNLVEVALPESITQIWYRAFMACYNLEKVTIGNSTTTIGEQAFSRCNSLKSIIIPEGIKTIEKNAFNSCSSLSTVSFPSSLTGVYDDAFSECNSISKVNIADLSSWCSIYFSNYLSNPTYYSKKIYIGNSSSPVTSLSIPNGVTSIGSYCFANCTGITSLTIPTTVTNIRARAFSGCSGLVSLNVPEGVTTIGSYCFEKCSNIRTVRLPSTLTQVMEGAFNECISINKVTTPSIAAWCSIDFSYNLVWKDVIDSYGNIAYTYDSEDGEYKLATSFPCYKSNPLYYSQKLYIEDSLITELDIPEGVQSIGRGAFANCTSITSVSLPMSLSSIREMAFYGCGNISNVKINSINSWNKMNFIASQVQFITLGPKDSDGYYYNYDYSYQYNYSSNPIYASCTNSLSDSGNIEWASTNPAVAQVDNKGGITALSSGSTVILATSNDNHSFCNFTIDDPSIISGDVNGDGHLSISDVTYLIDLLLGFGGDVPASADVNGNGVVNISDVTDLIDMLLGGS